MADVMIIAGETDTICSLRTTLECQGYAVAVAHDAIAALPELYMSPTPLVVIAAGTAEDAVGVSMLVASDPEALGRHTVVALGEATPAALHVPLATLAAARAFHRAAEDVLGAALVN